MLADCLLAMLLISRRLSLNAARYLHSPYAQLHFAIRRFTPMRGKWRRSHVAPAPIFDERRDEMLKAPHR